MKKFVIRVPASSANIGPGFDSAGIAINRFLTLYVTESEKWEFKNLSPLLPSVDQYKDHYIYNIAKDIAAAYDKVLPTATVEVDSEIPLARGMGSSSSAIIAGIELANQLCDLQLTEDQKLEHSVKIEGHPDNVAAALFGGFVLAVQLDEAADVDYIKLPKLDLDVVVYIPHFELKTADARKVLPNEYKRNHATSASAISNVMVAALLTGNFELAGKMMEEDRFHETYRAQLIPRYDEIRAKAKSLGAYGTVISGAGPTTISFVPKNKAKSIQTEMQKLLPDYEVASLHLDETGLEVTITE